MSGHPDNRGFAEPAALRDELLRLGVPEDAITTDDTGRRTIESLRSCRDRHRIRNVTIITDDFHAHRAVFLARTLGLDAVAVRAGASESWCVRWHRHIRESLARCLAVWETL